MRAITSFWKNIKESIDPPKVVSARDAIPRYRETPSGPFPAVRQPATATAEATPVPPVPAIAPPPWSSVFPAHHQALCDDLRRRGEDPGHWEFADGQDLGVSEQGHTVAFTLRKTGTSAVIRVELTLCRGKVARLRVH
jgi:hypothetical protein